MLFIQGKSALESSIQLLSTRNFDWWNKCKLLKGALNFSSLSLTHLYMFETLILKSKRKCLCCCPAICEEMQLCWKKTPNDRQGTNDLLAECFFLFSFTFSQIFVLFVKSLMLSGHYDHFKWSNYIPQWANIGCNVLHWLESLWQSLRFIKPLIYVWKRRDFLCKPKMLRSHLLPVKRSHIELPPVVQRKPPAKI